MTRAAFLPRDDMPEWRKLYDALLVNVDVGDVITYAQLDAALGRPFLANRSPLYRARQELGEMRNRWLEAVPGVGYRVPEAEEHLRIAQDHKRKGKRQFGQMMRVQEVTDLSRLTAQALDRFQTQAQLNAVLYQVAVHHEKRLNRIEAILRNDGKL